MEVSLKRFIKLYTLVAVTCSAAVK